MSILSDGDIVNRLRTKSLHGYQLVIEPCRYLHDVQSCSVDLHLGDTLKKLSGETIQFKTEENEDGVDEYVLKPNEFILGATSEYVEIPIDLVGIVEGRSSIGRLGIFVHVTAGYVDSGFRGNITLELKNASNQDFILKNGMNICQIVFETLLNPCKRPYGSENLNSKYQNSKGVVLSKYKY